MHIIGFLLVACVVVWIFLRKTRTTLDQTADEEHIAEAQRQFANEYRSFERRERERAMRK